MDNVKLGAYLTPHAHTPILAQRKTKREKQNYKTIKEMGDN